MELVNEIKNKIDIEYQYLDFDQKVYLVNQFREYLHNISPFKNEPVDFVKWVKCDEIVANDYNPNKVAPPEMELLEISIINDGYTQPIVTWQNEEKDKIEVIDGFHRNRVGKESKIVNQRINGYLPTVIIRKEKEGKNDRIASTIRHNRARGKHQIDAMSEIVLELKNRNWTNSRIARELGMDEDEILRLCQITGLEHLFTDKDFSRSWESSDVVDDYEVLTDEIVEGNYRTVNTNDEDRIFHTFDKWECHKAGFYASKKEGMTEQECINEYALFLNDESRFRKALQGVIDNWKNSCEHYLTNKAMNRIAWLGQAAMCYDNGIPSKYCSGYNLLTKEQQKIADSIALEYLNQWMLKNGRAELEIEEALSIGRQVNIY